jgi:hypothetical protein
MKLNIRKQNFCILMLSLYLTAWVWKG